MSVWLAYAALVAVILLGPAVVGEVRFRIAHRRRVAVVIARWKDMGLLDPPVVALPPQDYADAIKWWLFVAGETGYGTIGLTGRMLPPEEPDADADVDDPLALAHRLAGDIGMSLARNETGWHLNPSVTSGGMVDR